jgi:hypothetical protein
LYHSDTNNSGYGYLHNERPNYYADVTYYLDDITVNYSSAVDDNVAPVIGSASISHDAIDTPVSMKGQVVNANKVTFTAKATDNYSGLDTSSAAIYVDGVRYDASCSDIGLISSGDMILPNGAHVVRFEISDKMGNVSSFYEYYVVLNGTNTSNTITYGPKDPTLTNVGEGSLVWMDLTADAIELVDKVSTVIDLDQNSKWELAHMELAEGFMDYYIEFGKTIPTIAGNLSHCVYSPCGKEHDVSANGELIGITITEGRLHGKQKVTLDEPINCYFWAEYDENGVMLDGHCTMSPDGLSVNKS